LTAISLALTILLLFPFGSQTESLMGVPLPALFSVSNLWVSGLVVLFLFLTAGIIPARLFSVIPVVRIFGVLSNDGNLWKKVLLFIQYFWNHFCYFIIGSYIQTI
jgi:putative ABC transport system permease protein